MWGCRFVADVSAKDAVLLRNLTLPVVPQLTVTGGCSSAPPGGSCCRCVRHCGSSCSSYWVLTAGSQCLPRWMSLTFLEFHSGICAVDPNSVFAPEAPSISLGSSLCAGSKLTSPLWLGVPSHNLHWLKFFLGFWLQPHAFSIFFSSSAQLCFYPVASRELYSSIHGIFSFQLCAPSGFALSVAPSYSNCPSFL